MWNFTVEEINEMEDTLSSFLNYYGIHLETPVDIFKLANEIGFDVRGADFAKTYGETLEGLVLVNEFLPRIEGFDSNKVIAYNCHRDIMEKKFIVAHELAHYIEEKVSNFEDKLIAAARDHQGDYSNNKDEQRKDYIAAAILIPKNDMIKRFKNRKDDKNLSLKLSRYYNVPIELAERRIQEVFNG